jgi:tetratricopeptide (TPR) repeat protein
MRIFISHSSKNKRIAGRLSGDVAGGKVDVWLDRNDLHSGDPLLDELQHALEACTHMLLLWSKPASESRYVKAEWQAAFDLQKAIIPCLLDGTPLPVFLRRFTFCDMRRTYEKGLAQIEKALRAEAEPPHRTEEPSARRDKQAVIDKLVGGQAQVLEALAAGTLVSARKLQVALDPIVNDALRRWRSDEVILNLAGYRLKNAYLIKYWNKISSGEYPWDPVLIKAEQMFHSALGIRPDDPSAKNGLGNIYWFRGDLDAAEFFVRHAIASARRQGFRYEAAEHDLQLMTRERAARKRRPSRGSGSASRSASKR